MMNNKMCIYEYYEKYRIKMVRQKRTLRNF